MANNPNYNKDLPSTRILETAKKMFAEEGFHKTHRTKIRTAARVGEGTISTYFEDEELEPKETILIKILEKDWAKIDQSMDNLRVTSMDVINTLREILSIILDTFERDRDLRIIFIAHSRELYGFGKRLMVGPVRNIVEKVESIFKYGQNKGVFRKELTPKSMQRAFFGTIKEFLHSRVLSETTDYQTEISRQELEKTIDFILLGFLKEIPEAEFPMLPGLIAYKKTSDFLKNLSGP